jgi:aryl-alcohol dehydrogenase-like predicted oxidoreductase
VRYRQLGRSELTVSVVGLGCTNFGKRTDLEQTRAVVHAALDAGVNLLDTADIYGGQGASEFHLGQVLRGRRDDVVLATKFGSDMGGAVLPSDVPRGSRRYVRAAVEGSLRRLGTDRIDLYQLHEPDPRTPVEETLGALDELVREGSVRYIGSSNLAAWQIADADWTARTAGTAAFVSVQNEYSLLVRDAEHEVLPVCERLGLGFVPYFPLASGLLTGKYRRGEPAAAGTRLAQRDQIATDRQFDVLEALERFAAERQLTLTEVAIGALLTRPVVSSVIAGATKPEQVRANAAAARWTPSDEDLAALNDLLAAAAP